MRLSWKLGIQCVRFCFNQMQHNMEAACGHRPRPVVFCGPSGSGKSTLLKRIIADYPDIFGFSVSHTTRKPRPLEKHGVDYFFVTRDCMLSMIAAGEFVEHAEFSGNMYGTSKKAIHDVMSQGRICILDIDMQGVLSMKKTDITALYLFIRTPTIEDLETRLRQRGTETEAAIQKRLAAARKDIALISGQFDHVIQNDNLECAYLELRGILQDDIKAAKHCALLKQTRRHTPNATDS